MSDRIEDIETLSECILVAIERTASTKHQNGREAAGTRRTAKRSGQNCTGSLDLNIPLFR
jgi:hypothetical protein